MRLENFRAAVAENHLRTIKFDVILGDQLLG